MGHKNVGTQEWCMLWVCLEVAREGFTWSPLGQEAGHAPLDRLCQGPASARAPSVYSRQTQGPRNPGCVWVLGGGPAVASCTPTAGNTLISLWEISHTPRTPPAVHSRSRVVVCTANVLQRGGWNVAQMSDGRASAADPCSALPCPAALCHALRRGGSASLSLGRLCCVVVSFAHDSRPRFLCSAHPRPFPKM